VNGRGNARGWRLGLLAAALAGAAALAFGGPPAPSAPPFSDWRSQRPGVVRKIQVSDLPLPNRTRSVDNGPKLVPRPPSAWPQAPDGFQVQLYATGLTNPRLIRTAPNGDVFVVESQPGELRLLRGIGPDGRARESVVFARGFKKPFGIAFYPPGGDPSWLYVANTDSVVRLPYRAGDRSARGQVETVVPELPGGGLLRGGGHWTRDIAFSRDGKQMWISVGSRSNNDDVDDNPAERERADILVFDAIGAGRRVYASGIRNAVGIAVHPRSGELWASVNERDMLGDDLVPDYITHVQDGGFYGWPWFYMGGHWDPRHRGKHADRRAQVINPDVLVQPHNASLQMTFYDGQQFPDAYRGDIFAAEHGSWNRAVRTGYEVIRVPMHGKDRPTGEYEDFLTGFVTSDGAVWGRPVGVTVAADGALLVTDDGSNSVWRVSYANKSAAPQPSPPK
jgi:glucose/arabinose dehydrogenase